ncbi:MAG: hypothetical protein Q8O30_02890 [Candidatus Omnitrophota bacterium]|nr:hypothetical protein [Candidatus Omnitrophota bacterium]
MKTIFSKALIYLKYYIEKLPPSEWIKKRKRKIANHKYPYVKEFVMNVTAKRFEKFERLATDYEQRGILNSEMLATCSLCEELGVDVIIESGRGRGQSTHIFARYFENKPCKIFSIEWKESHWFSEEDDKFAKESVAPYHNVEFLYGDGRQLIPVLVKEHKGMRIAVILDGPKEQTAVNLLKQLFRKYKNISVAFLHDCNKGLPCRLSLEDMFYNVFFTDCQEYVDRYRKLDIPCDKEGGLWHPYRLGTENIESYGPTLAIVFPDNYKFRQ